MTYFTADPIIILSIEATPFFMSIDSLFPPLHGIRRLELLQLTQSLSGINIHKHY